MARSHHRKKHKQHLRTYQHSKDVTLRTGKSKVTAVFTLLGTALGLGIAYFAANSNLVLVAGAIVGALAGYLIGRRVDENI
jgi:hypothetical protein